MHDKWAAVFSTECFKNLRVRHDILERENFKLRKALSRLEAKHKELRRRVAKCGVKGLLTNLSEGT